MVIQVNRFSDGARRVTSIAEITGMEQDVITMQEIFVVREDRRERERQGHGPLPRHRHPSEVRGEADHVRLPLPTEMFEHVARREHAAGTRTPERVRSFR